MSEKVEKPPFKADHVGSLLRPPELLEARERKQRGEITAAELREVEDAAIRKAVALQEKVGLQAVTDGEFRRVGVRVQMTATVTQLVRVLYALEAGRTFLFVDNLEVSNRRARRRRNQPVDMDPTLLVRLDLSGYLRPEAG